MNFSERLMKLRKEKGLSQEELAEKLDVTRQTVSKWELGVSTPEMEKLIQMSNFFGVSVDELISNSDSTSSSTNTSAEFVGVDEKYIPKNDGNNNNTYVKEDDKARKFVKGYLIFFIVFFILLIGSIIFFIIRMFSLHTTFKGVVNSTDKAFNTYERSVERVLNTTENMVNDIEADEKQKNEITNEVIQDKDSSSVQNKINEAQEKAKQESLERMNETKEKIEEVQNKIENEGQNIVNSEEFNNAYNQAKDKIEKAIQNINF